MSGDYSRVSTNDDDEGVAASPASANGKPLLKKDKDAKKPFIQQAKADFWSNVNFVCCGGYKSELKELQRERAAFSGVVRRRQQLSCEMRAAAGTRTHSKPTSLLRVICRERDSRQPHARRVTRRTGNTKASGVCYL